MRKFLIWILVLLLIPCIGLFWMFWIYKNKITPNMNKNNLPITSTPKPIDVKTTEKVLLTKDGKISFPEIKEENQISAEKLPKNIADLVGKKAQNIIVKEIVYTTGKKGFLVSYTYPGWSSEAFREKIKPMYENKKWEVLVSDRADNFAFADLEDTFYQVRLVSSQGEDSSTKEIITAIEK